MVRSYTQWLRVGELMRSGRIGELRAVPGFFSYFNIDPANIRNQVDAGGGALLDIGCYCIQAARYGFGAGAEGASSASSNATRSCIQTGLPRLCSTSKADRLSSLAARSSCPTSASSSSEPRPHRDGDSLQRAHRPPDPHLHRRDRRPLRQRHPDRRVSHRDQYTMQGDAFSRAVLEGGEVPVPLEEAIANMAVIEAIFRSGETRQWESPAQ